jgi:hypothetical protein
MIKANVGRDEAAARLKRAEGFVRAAIEGTEYHIVRDR